MAGTLGSSLFDGFGGAATLAGATAAYRLMRTRQDRKRLARKTDTDELQALRQIVDALVEFLAPRPSVAGLPAPPGFLETFATLQAQVGELTMAVHELRQIVGTDKGVQT